MESPVSRDTTVISLPPPPARGPFVGVRTAGFVALLSAFGGLAGVGMALILDRIGDGQIAGLERQLEEREAAGQLAHKVLAEAEAKAHAQRLAQAKSELALSRARAELLAINAAQSVPAEGSPAAWTKRASELTRAQGEVVGLVSQGRAFGLSHLGLSQGATISHSLPSLSRALAAVPKTPGSSALLVLEGLAPVVAAASPIGPGSFALATVPTPPDPEPDTSLADARRVVGSLAAPADPSGPAGRPLPLFVLATLLASLLAGLIAHRSIARPLAKTLTVARDFAHGQPDVRADAGAGGRDARDVARAVNALIERAERHQAQGRAARAEDVQGAALAIISFGQGDLRAQPPLLREPFEPIGAALVEARRELVERVTLLHQSASQVARSASELAPAAKRVSDAAQDQHAALRHLGEGVAEAVRSMDGSEDKLAAVVSRLEHHGAEQRRTIEDLRTSLYAITRRSGDLKSALERLTALFTPAASLDQALGLLQRMTTRRPDEALDLPPARVAATVGEARAAFETLARELGSLKEEMAAIGEGLSAIAGAQPDAASDVKADATAPLFELASAMVRVVELSAGSLKALERAHRSMSEGAHTVLGGASSVQAQLSVLAPALATIRVGAAFEDALLERLMLAKKEYEAAASSPDRLTPDGRRLLADVQVAAETARARLAQLVEATESALDLLRS